MEKQTEFEGRDTIVVEWQYPEKIGSDKAGSQKTVSYIETLLEVLEIPKLEKVKIHPHSYKPKQNHQNSIPNCMPTAEAHLCDKYGYAGFGTGENGIYGHAYFWDQHAPGYEDQPPFGTMDVSFPENMSNQVTPEKIIAYTKGFFDTNKLTWKASNRPEQIKNFIDFAPHILRQRLLIQGILAGEINTKKVKSCMEQLCKVLEMGKLSNPKVYDRFAFMHWEDSGTVASWTKDIFNIDIYTCKGFEVQKATDFIQDNIQQKICKILEI